jgi:hypothetical protein
MARENAFASRSRASDDPGCILFTFKIIDIALQKTQKRPINFPRQEGHIKREHEWACQQSSYPQAPYQFLNLAQIDQGMLCITVDTILIY